jgi:methanethiol S-methyltransferase
MNTLTLYITSTLIFILFAVVHTVTASVWFKKRVLLQKARFKVWYRTLYNLISILIILAWLFTLPPDTLLYQLEGVLFFIFSGLLIFFGWLFLMSVFSQHGLTFLGLKQIADYFRYDVEPQYLDEPKRGHLVTTGLYRHMRHPMYTFAILTLASSPIMTANLLYSIAIFSLYFWIGSYFEEKNLINRFGQDYIEYQKKVPRFFPRIRNIT